MTPVETVVARVPKEAVTGAEVVEPMMVRTVKEPFRPRRRLVLLALPEHLDQRRSTEAEQMAVEVVSSWKVEIVAALNLELAERKVVEEGEWKVERRVEEAVHLAVSLAEVARTKPVEVLAVYQEVELHLKVFVARLEELVALWAVLLVPRRRSMIWMEHEMVEAQVLEAA